MSPRHKRMLLKTSDDSLMISQNNWRDSSAKIRMTSHLCWWCFPRVVRNLKRGLRYLRKSRIYRNKDFFSLFYRLASSFMKNARFTFRLMLEPTRQNLVEGKKSVASHIVFLHIRRRMRSYHKKHKTAGSCILRASERHVFTSKMLGYLSRNVECEHNGRGDEGYQILRGNRNSTMDWTVLCLHYSYA